jgi:hypothetical protein
MLRPSFYSNIALKIINYINLIIILLINHNTGPGRNISANIITFIYIWIILLIIIWYLVLIIFEYLLCITQKIDIIKIKLMIIKLIKLLIQLLFCR